MFHLFLSCGIILPDSKLPTGTKAPIARYRIASMEKGTYALLIALGKEIPIAVGRLGLFIFPPGYYIYVGSAQGGLYPRVRRHLRGEKRRRWHVDYLLEFAQVVEVWYALGDESQECLWRQIVHEMPQGEIPVKGFGSSDCRCPSHLIRFPALASFVLFRERLGEWGSLLRRATPESMLASR